VASGDSSIASFSPDRYGEIPVLELLRAASRGWIGIDRRLIQSIVDHPNFAADVLAFSQEPPDQQRLGLDPVLTDLFRYSSQPEALPFFIDAIRREPDDVDDSLIQALLPFGERAIDPLLALYEELGEERGSDVAFLLAGLRIRDPRVRDLLLERLEFDAADGAFCLGLYGDPTTRPALEKMLAEVSSAPAGEDDDDDDGELRREISHALEALDAPEPQYNAEAFDILAEYPKKQLPEFDLLTEPERIELLASPDPEVRAEAAYSFFNAELHPKVRAILWEMARNDADPKVRGQAWQSLADVTEDAAVRDAMLAVLKDTSKPTHERGGAAVGLYGVADRAEIHTAIEALYEEGGLARVKALETMWRSLWKPYAKYFAPHLDDSDQAILHQALRGAGYFRLTALIDKIAKFLDDDDLREDALFAYALAMPGETTRGRAKGMLRKIDSVTALTPEEARLVAFAIDERLRLHGLDPVFENLTDTEDEDEHAEHAAPAPPPANNKPGRNDPCPCGSGKKFKKCHGK
jgi:hypothetical protein